ncbi:hypothetical protein G4B88_011214 [Cannabis sativa]|uniref:DUF4283 domain-containing protein n=1 Tax=Cannabis sativa TaxID=3483 RepID=A0A7J6GD55_CANSA|nr:hypothetical protein G4B88_011214 [Cannabis sativa]
MADASLTALFEDSVQVSTNDLTCDLHPGEVDPNEEPSRILLGKLYCHSRLGRKAIHGSLKNAWSTLTGWSWKEREDGLLQFTFLTRMDAENVLLRRPWLVCGYLLVLMPWPSWLTPMEVVFDQTPIWVRLKSIPPFYWNKTNLQELAGKVSSVYELPRYIEKNFERGSFGMGTLRFRATVDVNKPLFSGFYLRRKGIKDLWIQYQYERLPKLCFKCGALAHDLRYCFKTPTVIKDANGVFFPMYGTWMDEDAKEKSPFHLPLPKWFNDWISQQKELKDPAVQKQMVLQRKIQRAEASEWRELKRQLPGKRRQVEVVVEDRPEAGEVVMNRFPAVELLGIGEITPFENTAEGVVEKVIPIRPLHEIVTVPGVPTNPDPAIYSTKPGQPGPVTEACSHAEEPDKTNVNLNALENGGKGNLPTKGMKSPGNPCDSDIASSSNGSKVAVRDEGNFTLLTKFQVGQSFNPLLGPQAQPLDWPSRACWASAFGPLTGSKTVDKYHREPTIFNPILCIDDFNCYESEHGPRKRKAMDGFYMIPGVIPSPETIPTLDASQNTLANTELQPDIKETTTSIFSPGSSDDKPAKRKRGRPRKCDDPTSTPIATDKKRGRPPRDKAWTGVTPKSLKKRGVNSSSRGKTKHYRNLWNAKCFDLAIDLDNHFVVKEADKNALLGSIESDPPGTKWNFIGIYGPPTMSGREDF